MLGRGRLWIIVRHILPNVTAALFVLATLGLGQAVIWVSSLSYLGLGAVPPAAEWGAMLAAGRTYIANFWWMTFFPGLAIVAGAAAATVIGRGIQQRNRSAAVTGPNQPVLNVRDLVVAFPERGRAGRRSERRVVDGVSFQVAAGECVAIVGESGSGKSVTARSIVGLAGEGARVTATELGVDGQDVLSLSGRRLRALRGGTVGLIAQDALVSLDPLRPVGREIGDTLALHTGLDAAARRARTIELLDRVGLPDAELRAGQRPGQLSGGQRQRALIAAGIAGEPRLVIADEPTTALDQPVQAGVLRAAGAAARRRHRRAAHQPRLVGGPGHRRPGPRHDRRRSGRGGHADGGVRAAPPPVHPQAGRRRPVGRASGAPAVAPRPSTAVAQPRDVVVAARPPIR